MTSTEGARSGLLLSGERQREITAQDRGELHEVVAVDHGDRAVAAEMDPVAELWVGRAVETVHDRGVDGEVLPCVLDERGSRGIGRRILADLPHGERGIDAAAHRPPPGAGLVLVGAWPVRRLVDPRLPGVAVDAERAA